MPEMKSLTLNDKTYDCFVDSVARAQVEATAVISEASGEQIVVTDASNYKFVGFNVYGKTTQNGTPTPDATIDLVSCGEDGSITVRVTGGNDAQTMTIATPNGLPGIPVSTGGNYTDGNGQQWLCDEINFARGVYVQRVNRLAFNGMEPWSEAASKFNNCVAFNYTAVGKHTANGAWTTVISNAAPTITATDYTNKDVNGVGGYGQAVTFKILKTVLGIGSGTNEDALDKWLSYLASKSVDGTPVSVQYILATPVETTLSEEELATYAALHSYRNHTTVSNDAGAWMDVEYVMDVKKYIDSMAIGAIVPARVE